MGVFSLKRFQGLRWGQVVVEGGRSALHWRNTRYVYTAATSPDKPQEDTKLTTVDVPKKDNTPVSAIAGGVVGGVAGVSLIGVLVWWLLRRKRRAATTGYTPAQYEMNGVASPTELPSHAQTPYGQTHYDRSHYSHTPEPAPSELAGRQKSPPAELDTPVAELDGSSQVPHRII